MKLLSDTYLAALKAKQIVKPWRGTHGRYAGEVAKRLRERDTVLDFGCANQDLSRVLRANGVRVRVTGYDPAQPGLDRLPNEQFDIIVATDVMEHVEIEYLEPTLRWMERACRREMFFVINVKATGHLLSDGLDHHRIVQSKAWWLGTLERLLPGWSTEVVFVVKKDFGVWLTRR